MKAVIPVIFALLFSAQDSLAQNKSISSSDTIVLNHIAMYVRDLDKSTTFYKEVLKFRKVADPFNDGKHSWFDMGPTSRLHLIQGAEGVATRDKNDHLCFSVPSVEAFIERLKTNKVSYSDWPGKPSSYTVRVDGVKQIYFQDPDGHWIEINDDGFKK